MIIHTSIHLAGRCLVIPGFNLFANKKVGECFFLKGLSVCLSRVVTGFRQLYGKIKQTKITIKFCNKSLLKCSALKSAQSLASFFSKNVTMLVFQLLCFFAVIFLYVLATEHQFK